MQNDGLWYNSGRSWGLIVQKQRVVIVYAIARSSKILFIDEATGALDID